MHAISECSNERKTMNTSARNFFGRRSGRTAIAAVAALALATAACGGGDSSSETQGTTETTTPGPTALRVSYVPATTVLPLHIAKAQGIFEKNNLNVTLTEAANISDIPATLGRQFDLASGPPPTSSGPAPPVSTSCRRQATRTAPRTTRSSR